MNREEIQLCYQTALGFIKDAGKILLTAKDIVLEEKAPGDIVSEYDVKVENVLIRRLKMNFPTHKFIGEEESHRKKRISELSNDPTWIIDPIDGTSNFVRGFPTTCISVGLVVNKEQIMGIIYNPFSMELYTAIKGSGAYLNGERIYSKETENIGRASFIYELSLAKTASLRKMYLTRLKYLINEVEGIRSFGCAAMSICYIARGYFESYQCDGLFPWDYAAAALILREAGGYVCDPTGVEFDLLKGDILACCTKKLAEQFVEVVNKADEEWKILP
ncbi:inositol monophosphatase 2-like [Agrilus planipennis]|uniref:Inositol-1-monophosphatase n=1 Tax=Agrilus planipennis TaxID=224129 RepID=A0A1W4X834_AGRPL|nr:inositol monophosphatase 2-like [Agrilus planipennis]